LKLSGTAAHNHCIEEGGFLAFFINQEEFSDFTMNYRVGNEHLWMGYTQKFPNNKDLYVSADGEDARFLKWEPNFNEPNSKNEQCVELYGQNSWMGSRNNMNDRGCGEQREFFCRFSQQGACQTTTTTISTTSFTNATSTTTAQTTTTTVPPVNKKMTK
jgi:hypothetical protein